MYPYKFIDTHQKFEEVQLPPGEASTDETVCLKDYKHAQNVCREFNWKTLVDYHIG